MSAKVKSKTAAKQKFIRLNLDEKLETMLDSYQQKYTLLTKAEIVRMLLNEGDWKVKNSSQKNKTTSSFKEILSDSKFLDLENEDEQFAFVKKHFGV